MRKKTISGILIEAGTVEILFAENRMFLATDDHWVQQRIEEATKLKPLKNCTNTTYEIENRASRVIFTAWLIAAQVAVFYLLQLL